MPRKTVLFCVKDVEEMLRCKNCGGNYHFDIESQKLLCPHCGGYASPEEMDTFEAKTYDTYVFNCPQCGGNISADDNEAQVFCPYCGLSTMLEGRLEEASRPDYIIPFKKTKEDCVKEYKKLIRKSIYAPKMFKTKGSTDSFRGVYIPYWDYNIKHSDAKLSAIQTQVNLFDDETTVVHYVDVDVKMDVEYEGITFDASESFDDELSNSIAPYDVKDKMDFAPGYMSGFYADTSDVPFETYNERANNMAANNTYNKIRKRKEFRRYKNLNEPKDKNKEIIKKSTTNSELEVGMMPVWFMSWKYGNRIAYASINGQTGKASGKIPASPLKFILFSLITAIPTFFILGIFSMPRPELSLLISNALALIVLLMYDYFLHRSVVKDEIGKINKNTTDNRIIVESTGAHMIVRVCTIVGFAVCVPLYYVGIYFSVYPVGIIYMINIIVVALEVYLIIASTIKSIMKASQKRIGYLGIVLGGIASCVLIFVNPIQDIYYYISCFATIILAALALVDLIHYHNVLSTIPMPQFSKKGGNDEAVQ